MSYEEFWYKDPRLIKAYSKAEDLRVKRKNQELWLQGYYVYAAIGAFTEVLPAFPKKGAKVQSYIEEPIPLSEAEWINKEEQEKQVRIQRIKDKMLALAEGR